MEISSVLVEYESVEELKTYASSGILINNKFVIITTNILANLLKTDDLYTKLFYCKQSFINPKELLLSVPKLNVILNIIDNKIEYRDGTVLSAFVSNNIRDSSKRILGNWSIDNEDNLSQMQELISLFYVITIDEKENHDSLNEFKNFLKQHNEDLDENFYIGKEVAVDSTPFGNRNFFNTYSRGIISNILGENDCLILTDCPTAIGSDGGLVLT